jgi:hypothetical protein
MADFGSFGRIRRALGLPRDDQADTADLCNPVAGRAVKRLLCSWHWNWGLYSLSLSASKAAFRGSQLAQRRL